MNDDNQITSLIKKIADSRGLYASIAHFNGGEDELYNVSIYGVESVTIFEFNWYKKEDEISYNVLLSPAFKSISNKRYQEIEEIFKDDLKTMESISMRKDGTLIAIKGTFDKSIYSEPLIEEIIDYFNEPSPAIKKLYELINK